jgi:hypothetical protein
MKTYKKGDWIITPYNNYPIQLEEDACFGFFDASNFAGDRFFECCEKEAVALGKTYVCAIKDPRYNIIPIRPEGWYFSERVRFAKKRDFDLLIREAKKQVLHSQKILKRHIRVRASI